MATNNPTGDKARKGAVRKRTQLRTKVMGEARERAKGENASKMSYRGGNARNERATGAEPARYRQPRPLRRP